MDSASRRSSSPGDRTIAGDMAVLLWTERTAHKKNVPFSVVYGIGVALLEIGIRGHFFCVTSRAMDREEISEKSSRI